MGDGGRLIVAVDYGIKTTIVRNLAQLGRVEVVPAATTATDILARDPDGVFLSNGPGDPGVVQYAADEIAQLIGNVPVFGICLGHQLLGRALGAGTVKLPFGHVHQALQVAHGHEVLVLRLEPGHPPAP